MRHDDALQTYPCRRTDAGPAKPQPAALIAVTMDNICESTSQHTSFFHGAVQFHKTNEAQSLGKFTSIPVKWCLLSSTAVKRGAPLPPPQLCGLRVWRLVVVFRVAAEPSQAAGSDG